MKTSWYPLMFVVNTTSATVVGRLRAQRATKQGSVLEEEEPWNCGAFGHRATAWASRARTAPPDPMAQPWSEQRFRRARRRSGRRGRRGRQRNARRVAGRAARGRGSSGSRRGEGLIEHRPRRARRASTRSRARARGRGRSPPPHQLVLVSRLPAWRVPRSESAELLTPPKLAARPLPFPACSRMAVISTRLSMMSRTSRNVNMPRSGLEKRQGMLNLKYAGTYGVASSDAGDSMIARHALQIAGPALGLEARPAHEETVNCVRAEERRRVRDVHAAAVEDRNRRRWLRHRGRGAQPGWPAWADDASCGVAVRPVPIAQTGS